MKDYQKFLEPTYILLFLSVIFAIAMIIVLNFWVKNHRVEIIEKIKMPGIVFLLIFDFINLIIVGICCLIFITDISKYMKAVIECITLCITVFPSFLGQIKLLAECDEKAIRDKDNHYFSRIRILLDTWIPLGKIIFLFTIYDSVRVNNDLYDIIWKGVIVYFVYILLFGVGSLVDYYKEKK